MWRRAVGRWRGPGWLLVLALLWLAPAARGQRGVEPSPRRDEDVETELARAVREGREAPLFDVGGTLRWQIEARRNARALPVGSDALGLFRATLEGSWRPAPGLHLFGDLHTALAATHRLGESPVDENRLFVQQLYAELETDLGAWRGRLRIGRQELSLGSARIFGSREGPNVRRTFDGLRASLDRGRWGLDAFALRPVSPSPGLFDDRILSAEESVFGAELARRGEGDEWELLWVRSLSRPSLALDAGPGEDEGRQTLGLRWEHRSGRWQLDWEVHRQWGRSGDRRVSAWAFGSAQSYRLGSEPEAPRIVLRAAVLSGDRDPGDRRVQAFDALYPRGSYFGEIATIGPSNLVSLHPAFEWAPAQGLTVEVGTEFLWRLSREDAVRDPTGEVVFEARPGEGRFIGFEPEILVDWEPAPGWSVRAIASVLVPGPTLRRGGADRPFSFLQLSVKVRW